MTSLLAGLTLRCGCRDANNVSSAERDDAVTRCRRTFGLQIAVVFPAEAVNGKGGYSPATRIAKAARAFHATTP